MNKSVKKVIAVALAAAMLVPCFCLSAFAAEPYLRDDGLFGVVPAYSTSDKLPYGDDSVIIEFNRVFYDKDLKKLGYFVYDAFRLNCASDAKLFVGYHNLSTYVYYTVTVISDYPMYICEFDYGGNMGQTAYSIVKDKHYTTTSTTYGNMAMSKKQYTFSFGCQFGTNSELYKHFYVHSNISPISDPSPYFSFGSGSFSDYYVYSGFLGSVDYPSSAGNFSSVGSYNKFPISNRDTSSYSYSGFWSPSFPAFQFCKYPRYNVKEDISKAAEDIKQNQDKNASEIISAVEEAVTQIIEAGKEMSGLDTDNNWLTEAITKLNGWLDSLDQFDSQMDENLQENQSNMEQAKTFINGFFGVMPKALVAIMSLVLVVLVVVKIIGR
jgi:hypothetical protein